MRTLVLGDIHGAFRALEQVLERAHFDPSNDWLIFVGDVADGWPETRDCVDLLLTFTNLIALMGNHDWWTMEWMNAAIREPIWVQHGGYATIDSYGGSRYDPTPPDVPTTHKKFFNELLPYFHDAENRRLYVHGGVYPRPLLEVGTPEEFLAEHDLQDLMWDGVRRDMANWVFDRRNFQTTSEPLLPYFDEIYHGHTSLTSIHRDTPLGWRGVWNLDTGAGWAGKLSIMDVDTKEVWQSDLVQNLYPEITNVRKKED